MTKNTEQLEGRLSTGETELFRQRLLELLAWQTGQYTMGDSSSVPVDLARELLDSLCYCLGVSYERPELRWRLLLQGNLREEYRAGLRRIEELTAQSRRLWQRICTRLPPAENLSLYSTLKSIGGLWKSYDSRFFALELPCDIDYQLALPVPEDALGIDYVNLYLSRLWCENRFLGEYEADALRPVLERCCPDYRGQLINLFEPVFSVALGLALLGRWDGELELERGGVDEIALLVENMRTAEIQAALISASDTLLLRHGLSQPDIREYTGLYCAQLAVRISALRDCGGLYGVFCAEQA